MRAYRHLELPAPPINMPPRISAETQDRNYIIRLEVPDCRDCHQKHTVIAHRLYVVLYSQLPFLCIHRKVIVEMGLDEVTIGPPVFLPARIKHIIPDNASSSTGGPADVEKILRDARAVSSAARTVVEYF